MESPPRSAVRLSTSSLTSNQLKKLASNRGIDVPEDATRAEVLGLVGAEPLSPDSLSKISPGMKQTAALLGATEAAPAPPASDSVDAGGERRSSIANVFKMRARSRSVASSAPTRTGPEEDDAPKPNPRKRTSFANAFANLGRSPGRKSSAAPSLARTAYPPIPVDLEVLAMDAVGRELRSKMHAVRQARLDASVAADNAARLDRLALAVGAWAPPTVSDEESAAAAARAAGGGASLDAVLGEASLPRTSFGAKRGLDGQLEIIAVRPTGPVECLVVALRSLICMR